MVRFAYKNLRTSHNHYHFAPVLISHCISKVNFQFVYLCYCFSGVFIFLLTYLIKFYRLQLEEQIGHTSFRVRLPQPTVPSHNNFWSNGGMQWTIRLTKLISSTYSAQALLVWLYVKVFLYICMYHGPTHLTNIAVESESATKAERRFYKI